MTADHQRGVLDTSTVVLLSRLTDADHLPLEPAITTITLAELSVGPLVTDDDAERAARQAHLQQAEADFEPLPFDAAAAHAWVEWHPICGRRRTGPKPTPSHALIAAVRRLPADLQSPRSIHDSASTSS